MIFVLFLISLSTMSNYKGVYNKEVLLKLKCIKGLTKLKYMAYMFLFFRLDAGLDET